MERYVGRLAPSPTGPLHLGHAATFLRAAARARAAGGRLLLRSEDLDRARVRPEFVAGMVEDLGWLGIRWDGPMTVQTERLALYRAATERLVATGAVYPCRCSRREVMEGVGAPHEQGEWEPVYGGRCRATGAAAAANGMAGLAEGTGVNWRFRVPDGEVVRFVDRRCGPQGFAAGCGEAADFGDFLVWRRDGLPSYQLACVVDDAATGVTEVVRGQDLLLSTARQILLQRALGLATPGYFHTGLLVDAAGVRLAKRHDALAVRTLRKSGMTAEAVRAMALSGGEAAGRYVAAARHAAGQREV